VAHSLTVGLVINTQELWREVQACLEENSTQAALEQPEIGEWTGFLEKIERVRPGALLLDLSGVSEPYEEVIARIKATTASPFVIALHVSADPEMILSALRAGADEFVYSPVAANLPKALERLAARRNRARLDTAKNAGRICGFFSAKGGCGATTIACHTAVELSRQTSTETLLADADLDAGMVGFLMKSKSRYSILDAMSNTHRLDLNYWKALVSNGVPRLEVIRAPEARAPGDVPQGDDLRTVLRFVRQEYGWTVIDLGRGLSPMVLSGLEEVDETYLVTTLDVPALHQVKRIVKHLVDYGYGSSRLRLVLNRVPKNPDVMPEELERLLGIPVFACLPDDYASVYEAYAEGKLLSTNTNLGKHLNRLAAKIAGLEEQPAKKKFSLFSS
jgi:pilus assembly protein CpaE